MNTELVISLAGSRKNRSLKLRFLLSRYFYEEEVMNDEEIEFLFYTILDLAEASEDQLDKKMKKRIYILNFMLESSRLFQKVPNKQEKDKIFFYCSPILLQPHEYYGLKNGNFKFIKDSVSSQYSVKRKEKIRYSEPRRIGVGYRDKGSAQNTAINGEMSWEYYSTRTEEQQEDRFKLANLLIKGSQLQSEIDNEIEDYFLDF